MCYFTAVLDKVREISRNAYAVAGRVQNLINSLTDSVRHVGESLLVRPSRLPLCIWSRAESSLITRSFVFDLWPLQLALSGMSSTSSWTSETSATTNSVLRTGSAGTSLLRLGPTATTSWENSTFCVTSWTAFCRCATSLVVRSLTSLLTSPLLEGSWSKCLR